MLAALWCVVSKLVSPLWRTVEGDEENAFSSATGMCNTSLDESHFV